jgi:glycosyltransferase involved in cell wall biosynthesis
MSDLRPESSWRLPESLSGFGIVYFGNSWRTENRTSSHHMAAELSRWLPVVYLDSPGLRAPAATGRDLRKLVRIGIGSASRPVKIRSDFWHGTVPQLPYRRAPGVGWLNRQVGSWAAKRAMTGIRCRGWISWFVVPHLGALAHKLGEQFCVYYCVDDYAAHPGVDQEVVTALDRQLAARADQVFVAPASIVDAKKAINPNTEYSPHGVDAELFGRACDPETPVPPIAKRLRRPVIGFFGLVAEWVDLELIAFMARARPGWSFLLVGHVAADTSALTGVGNVTLVGPQPYASLPGWAKSFDVALIPYRDVRQTRNANPLKLREYLAAGRPVVSTPNSDVERFRDWVKVAQSGPEFLAQVEAALSEDSAERARARRSAVASLTWTARAQSVLEIVGRGVAAQAGKGPGT